MNEIERLVAILALLWCCGYAIRETIKSDAPPMTFTCNHADLWRELLLKNAIIHRLEKRIYRLKRANRNLRATKGLKA